MELRVGEVIGPNLEDECWLALCRYVTPLYNYYLKHESLLCADRLQSSNTLHIKGKYSPKNEESARAVNGVSLDETKKTTTESPHPRFMSLGIFAFADFSLI